jgi:hypothetical protein
MWKGGSLGSESGLWDDVVNENEGCRMRRIAGLPVRTSQPLCSEGAGCWPNSECHSKIARQRGRGAHDLERLVFGPGRPRFCERRRALEGSGNEKMAGNL